MQERNGTLVFSFLSLSKLSPPNYFCSSHMQHHTQPIIRILTPNSSPFNPPTAPAGPAVAPTKGLVSQYATSSLPPVMTAWYASPYPLPAFLHLSTPNSNSRPLPRKANATPAVAPLPSQSKPQWDLILSQALSLALLKSAIASARTSRRLIVVGIGCRFNLVIG